MYGIKEGGVFMANNDWINQVIEDTMRGKQFKRRIQIGIDHL